MKTLKFSILVLLISLLLVGETFGQSVPPPWFKRQSFSTTIQTVFAANALDSTGGAGEFITAAATGGSVYINSITIQIITAPESAAITSFLLKSTESGTNDLNMPLRTSDQTLLNASDCKDGESYVFPVNHLLPVAGTLSLIPNINTASAGYVVSITYTAPFGASISGL
jgi:hypothetical protein